MNITQLAKVPKLVKIELSDQDIVDKYGEAVTFWMMDELGVNSYFKFYRLQQEQNTDELNSLLRELILKEDGSPALAKDEVLPVDIVLSVLIGVNDFLGKSSPKTLTNETGTLQK